MHIDNVNSNINWADIRLNLEIKQTNRTEKKLKHIVLFSCIIEEGVNKTTCNIYVIQQDTQYLMINFIRNIQ